MHPAVDDDPKKTCHSIGVPAHVSSQRWQHADGKRAVDSVGDQMKIFTGFHLFRMHQWRPTWHRRCLHSVWLWALAQHKLQLFRLLANRIIDELHVALIVDETFGIIEKKNARAHHPMYGSIQWLTCTEHVTNYNYLVRHHGKKSAKVVAHRESERER